MSASYVLPLKAAAPVEDDLDDYLAELAGQVEVIVVDGSPAEVYAAHDRRWRDLGATHVPVDPDLITPMGKVGGVLTGARRASQDVLIIADDDVRWTVDQVREAVVRLDGASVLRPQNHFDPTVWHSRWDTGRTLIARALGGDWPGTLVVDRSALVRGGGYDGAALFENLELVRTLQATGGWERVALDLLIARRPPTTRHFFGQRVRQAYDETARPCYLLAGLAIAPAVVLGGRRAAVVIACAAIALAEGGRRRAGGRSVFPATAALWAPCWVAERAVTSWLALAARAMGGARYGSVRLPLAAHRLSTLRRELSDRSGNRAPGWEEEPSHARSST